jgi:hypothetical protein
MSDEKENEKLARAFYEATVPGHREALRGIQAPHVIYDLPEGMPIGCGHFEGFQDVLDRFLTSFYGALDVRFVAGEFIAAGEHVVVLGRIQGKTRKAAVPVDVPFCPRLDGPRGVSPTIAGFYRHSPPSLGACEGVNYSSRTSITYRPRNPFIKLTQNLKESKTMADK